MIPIPSIDLTPYLLIIGGLTVTVLLLRLQRWINQGRLIAALMDYLAAQMDYLELKTDLAQAQLAEINSQRQQKTPGG